MTDDLNTHIKQSRMRVPRSRGALGGSLLIIFGAWAALIPFIGPYFDLAMTPRPNDAFHWTTGRGWLELLPGIVTLVGGLLLLVSANRLFASVGGWLAAAAGVWLVIGPALSGPFGLTLSSPDPAAGQNKQALIILLFFYGIGAAIVLVAGLALGRLSVHGVRDVRAAEHRAAAEAERQEAERREAQEAERRAAQDRAAHDSAMQERAAQEQAAQERAAQERAAQEGAAQERAAQEQAAQERAEQARAQERAAGDPALPDPAVHEGDSYGGAPPDGGAHALPETGTDPGGAAPPRRPDGTQI